MKPSIGLVKHEEYGRWGMEIWMVSVEWKLGSPSTTIILQDLRHEKRLAPNQPTKSLDPILQHLTPANHFAFRETKAD